MHLHFKLVVTDVDGTLADHRQQIAPRNLAAIARFQEAGGLVALATGRIVDSARRFAQEAGVWGPAILYNGGMVYDFATGEVLYEASLEPEAVHAALALLSGPFRQIDFVAYVGGRPYIPAFTSVIAEYSRKDSLHLNLLPSTGMPTGRVSKVLVIGGPDDLDRLEEALKHRYPAANTVRSETHYLELLPAGVSKGMALPMLAKRLGVPLEQTIAVGDHLNDLAMIRAAGLGVAVGNAHPALKAAAAVAVCPCPDGAVAEVIERFCLGSQAGEIRAVEGA